MEKILATSPLCGPCKIVKKYIEDNTLQVTIKDVSDDLQFFKDHGITSVPTLLVKEGGLVTSRYQGSPDILKYLQS